MVNPRGQGSWKQMFIAISSHIYHNMKEHRHTLGKKGSMGKEVYHTAEYSKLRSWTQRQFSEGIRACCLVTKCLKLLFKSTRFLLTIILSSLSRQKIYALQVVNNNPLLFHCSPLVLPLTLLFFLSVTRFCSFYLFYSPKQSHTWYCDEKQRSMVVYVHVWEREDDILADGGRLNSLFSWYSSLHSTVFAKPAVWVIEDWCPDVNDLSRTLSSVHRCVCVC